MKPKGRKVALAACFHWTVINLTYLSPTTCTIRALGHPKIKVSTLGDFAPQDKR
jgi:hypothetical protein